MKIGLTGTVSVGKTTLVNALHELPQFKNYNISTERSKYLMDLGIPLNTDSTILGQFIFSAERASELLQENIITDRTIWDVCAFTLSSKSIGEYEKRKLVEAAILMKDFYDVVIYVDYKDIPIENNGIRETNPEYRIKIDTVINLALAEYPPKKLIRVKGNTKERISTILQHL